MNAAHQLTMWLICMPAAVIVGVAIGMFVARHKWEEAEALARILEPHRRDVRAWLQRQEARPSAEAHLQHAHAVVAAFLAAAWTRLRMPSTSELTDGEARKQETRCSVIRWTGPFGMLLPGNARGVR